MAGHDYSDRFPDVIYEANFLAKHEDCELHVEGEIWWLTKKSKEI
jgi:ATP-dependent DNA ligase